MTRRNRIPRSSGNRNSGKRSVPPTAAGLPAAQRCRSFGRPCPVRGRESGIRAPQCAPSVPFPCCFVVCCRSPYMVFFRFFRFGLSHLVRLLSAIIVCKDMKKFQINKKNRPFFSIWAVFISFCHSRLFTRVRVSRSLADRVCHLLSHRKPHTRHRCAAVPRSLSSVAKSAGRSLCGCVSLRR